MQKIIPHLWFDSDAEEAVKFYCSIFSNSKISSINYYTETVSEVAGRPVGSVMNIGFELHGQKFMALNGGEIFKFTPAISFFVNCNSVEEVDYLWNKLIVGGSTLMELGTYPFSQRYGWLMDKHGLSWQINLGNSPQKITPSLLFVGKQFGKAKEAIEFYTSIFGGSVNQIAYYESGEGDEGKIKYSNFSLAGQSFIAMDSGKEHKFNFNEAVSLMVYCNDQDEIDYFWDKLSEHGEIQQCGWLKDKYGVSWQIVPESMEAIMKNHGPEKTEKIMKSLLKMKKIEISKLESE